MIKGYEIAWLSFICYCTCFLPRHKSMLLDNLLDRFGHTFPVQDVVSQNQRVRKVLHQTFQIAFGALVAVVHIQVDQVGF